MNWNSSTRILAVAALALAPGVSWGLNGGEGINGTPHDFTSTGTGDLNNVAGIGVCTFCHTPHKAQNTLLLWNHTLSTNTFKWEVAKTTAGTTLPSIIGNVYKGPSAKCLSCHDGSVAIGDVSWFKEQTNGTLGNSNLSDKKMTDFATEFQIGVGGNMGGNHPVAVPYPLNNAVNTYNGATNGGTGGTFATNEWQADPVASTVASIRLFQDDGTGNISAIPKGSATTTAGIECSSCHDPHNKASKDDLFLRAKISGSSQADGYLCLQCHSK